MQGAAKNPLEREFEFEIFMKVGTITIHRHTASTAHLPHEHACSMFLWPCENENSCCCVHVALCGWLRFGPVTASPTAPTKYQGTTSIDHEYALQQNSIHILFDWLVHTVVVVVFATVWLECGRSVRSVPLITSVCPLISQRVGHIGLYWGVAPLPFLCLREC